MRHRTSLIAALCVFACMGSGCWFPSAVTPQAVAPTPSSTQETPSPVTSVQIPQSSFGTSVVYTAPTSTVNPAIAQNFSLTEAKNLADMEKAYGITLTSAEKASLSTNKFLVKQLTDTSIRPNSAGDTTREFLQLYHRVQGQRDYKTRGPENAMFFSSDLFFNAYNNLYVELLKEMENKTFYPSITALSHNFYDDAAAHLASAQTDADKQKWMKVRNYFAVPYAIFSTAAEPLKQSDYMNGDAMNDPAKVQADFAAKDATVDTAENVSAFIRKLHLDAESEKAVLADIQNIYEASTLAKPAIFAKEYADYADQTGIDFKVDFSQFTPRGTYTSSSLRRQYFRGMKWYIMLPFFLKSADLTSYAFATSQLMAENPSALNDYSRLESAIDFMVGTSDDLMPVDYLLALQSAKGAPDEQAATLDYLVKAHNPKIKDLAANYPSIGTEQSSDVLLATKGMRFFSGKFIIDSYWTGYLTQGDEAPRPGYPQKLPPMPTSLEVMTLLGSEYAKTQLPKFQFYTPKYSKAIDKAIGELAAQNATLTEADWEKNLYTAWLRTISSLFSWERDHHASLPQFMQSPLWSVKTLQTATAFWTELRHATILYAKQSFAEMGGGGDNCDPRQVPPPPKGYIEPQAEAFARLSYLARRTDQGLKEQGYDLQNQIPLENFIRVLDEIVRPYVNRELGNATFAETVVTTKEADPNNPGKTCIEHNIQGDSDWETLRVKLMDGLDSSLPVPVEGPVLSVKDKRTSIVADVHTGRDSDNGAHILYEGEGVPYVILTAVKDANGPRLTVGFIYSQYEFMKDLGGKRLTDEDWQSQFYTGDDPYNAFNYTDSSTWPKPNAWYAPLFVK